MAEEKPNLFALAKGNVQQLQSKFDQLHAASSKRKKSNIDKLLDIIGKSELSINMGFVKLDFFFKNQELKCPYEVMNDTELQNHWKDYYAPRRTFDGYFADGERFTYIAVNPGSVGMPRSFGEYTVFVHKEATQWQNRAFLIRNSLKKGESGFHYFIDRGPGACQLDVALLTPDLSDDMNVGRLATIKLHGILDQEWAVVSEGIYNRICHDEPENMDYLECITTDRLVLGNIARVIYNEAAFGHAGETILDRDEQRDATLSDNLSGYTRIKERCDAMGIKIETA